MAQGEVLVLFFLALLCKAIAIRSQASTIDGSFCLSWRLAVETNNELPWRTVPNKCSQYVEDYLIHGQYERDLELIMEQALDYVNGISIVGDGKDAWILDVDDTCISNIYYYKSKNYGYVSFFISGYIFNYQYHINTYIIELKFNFQNMITSLITNFFFKHV